MNRFNDDMDFEFGEEFRFEIKKINLEEDFNFITSPDTNGSSEPHLEIHGMPGAYCTYYGSKDALLVPQITRKWSNIPPVLNSINFVHCDHSPLETIESIINKPSFNGIKSTIFSINEEGETVLSPIAIYNIEEGVYIDNTVKGIMYIKYMLESGMPVILGVNCLPYAVNDLDVSTNHYVVVVGMGNDGRNYLQAWDVMADTPYQMFKNSSSKDGILNRNRLYFDDYWPGLIRADRSWENDFSKSHQPYKVTNVYRTQLL